MAEARISLLFRVWARIFCKPPPALRNQQRGARTLNPFFRGELFTQAAVTVKIAAVSNRCEYYAEDGGLAAPKRQRLLSVA